MAATEFTRRRFVTRAQAIAEITEWIEIFYNRQRLHSRLGNLSTQAPSDVGGIELGLHHDAAADNVQPAGEAQ